MDLLIVVFLLFYSIIIEAKDFLRTGRGDDIRISENSAEEESPKDVDAILLVLDRHAASKKSKHIYPNFESEEPDKVWEEVTDSAETDASGDTNSEEYRDTESDAEGEDLTNNDGDGNIGHKVELSAVLQGKTAILRKKWRSCLKKGAKVCKEACVASYKTSCDSFSCKKKLKKSLKKECKRNCKDFFE